jgi:anti-sigma factor RsiW
MKHPDVSELALAAGGELPFLSRWRMSRHLRACERCRHEVRLFQAASEGLRAGVEATPMGVNWDRLAAEMTANIHVGLEAGECIEPRRLASVRGAADRLGWKPALVFGVMTALVVAGWFLVPQRTRWQQADAEAMVLQTTPNGIEVKNDRRALTMLHSKSENVVYTVNTEGEMGARYVDAETGQVTINHVYVE